MVQRMLKAQRLDKEAPVRLLNKPLDGYKIRPSVTLFAVVHRASHYCLRVTFYRLQSSGHVRGL